MDAKRLLGGIVVGGLGLYALGELFWGFLFAGFFESQVGSAIGLPREAPILWAEIVGTFSIATLLTLVIGWTGGSSMMSGFKTGALVGFLFWLGADLLIYANFNFSTLNGAVADAFVELLRTGLAGAAIVAVTGAPVPAPVPAPVEEEAAAPED